MIYLMKCTRTNKTVQGKEYLLLVCCMMYRLLANQSDVQCQCRQNLSWQANLLTAKCSQIPEAKILIDWLVLVYLRPSFAARILETAYLSRLAVMTIDHRLQPLFNHEDVYQFLAIYSLPKSQPLSVHLSCVRTRVYVHLQHHQLSRSMTSP